MPPTLVAPDGSSLAGDPDPPDPVIAGIARASVNRLAKWRNLFAGWQLGTRTTDDPESNAIRDHREATLLLRAETSTLIRLLIEKRVITPDELNRTLGEEAEYLSEMLARRFPGIRATDEGLDITPEAATTMRGWRP